MQDTTATLFLSLGQGCPNHRISERAIDALLTWLDTLPAKAHWPGDRKPWCDRAYTIGCDLARLASGRFDRTIRAEDVKAVVSGFAATPLCDDG